MRVLAITPPVLSQKELEMNVILRTLIALIALLLLGCGPKDDQFIDVKTAAAKQAAGDLMVDVREADDYKEFHIPNSMNIPYGRMKLNLAELEPYKGKTIMLIDHAALRTPWA
ncbi:MAG: rhodanese-like domain-containing protein, partial [Novosphingobium sp.]|uniref:rhodanese-like domain-containing protein n=1 Tax=Novosphingobium sp. TaxID=1874826 RepID=UPI003C7C1CD0